jgi:drug/metabolite transporter (DMT)-like permease
MQARWSPDIAPAKAASRFGIYALIASVTILWGLNWPAMKIAVTQMSPWFFRVVCVLAAGATLILISRLRGERVMLPPERILPLAAVAFVSVTAWHMLTAFGLLYMGSGRASIVAFTMPVWASILGVLFLGERLSLRHILGLVFGMAGMAILMGQDLAELGRAPIGLLLMLGAAMVWGIGTIGTKAFDWGVGVIALSGWQLLVGGIPIVAAWAILEGEADLSRVDLTGFLALLYVVFVALVFCFTAFLQLVRVLPASVAAISTLAIPVVGVASSAWLLGEQVGLAELSALVLVLAAMTLVLIPRQSRGR